MTANRSDIIELFGRFDADWYQARYPDVSELGDDPLAHFQTIGVRIGRGLSAECPGTDHLPDLAHALARRPAVSYCIPVMNRLADLQATLAYNLQQNADHADRIEFLILCFEDGTETRDWVTRHFQSHLHAGYLRFVQLPPLPIWHFGQAKSAFAGRLAGQVYSSLDADNFVTAGETEQLLSLIDDHGDRFLFHHFSGQWGDGSSGRITLPAAVYEQVRYDTRFLPRQFDEVDLILSALRAAPDLALLGYETDHDVLQAESVRGYLRTQRHAPAMRRLPPPDRRAPKNPSGAGYAAQDDALAAMQAFNEALSFLKNAPDAPRRSAWVGRLRQAAAQWVDLARPEDLERIVFGATPVPDMPEAEIVCLVPNVRGVIQPGAPKLVIDARPDPLPQGQTEDGHVILHPRVGDALVADLLWRGALARIFAARGAGSDAGPQSSGLPTSDLQTAGGDA